MTRKTVDVVEDDLGGRKPDASNFDDAVYWDDDRLEAEDLDEGKASIIPKGEQS